MDNKTYTFEDFRLNAVTKQLFARGEILKISSKGFDILLYLVKNRGKILTKDEIFNAVWGETIVEENNLPVHISALRRNLGEKHGESRFIKTVSGKGYIFIADVAEAAKSEPAFEDTRLARKIADQPHESIAVLPFVFDSAKPESEYLSNGITQSLIESLSQIPDFKVMSFTAVKNYRDSKLDLTEIGFQLSVDKILHGTLTEFENRLEINVELIDAADKSHLWGTDYRCRLTDVFAVRKEISMNIAEKLKVRSNRPEPAQESSPANSEVYRLYLKGKYILDNFQSSTDYRHSFQSALNYFRQSIRLDPNFAPAYIGSGRVYFLMFNDNFLPRKEAFEKCRTALQFALSADPTNSDTFVLEGIIRLFFEHKWQESAASFQRAVALNPNNSHAYHYLSFITACTGEFEQSVRFQNKALQFDPTSLLFNSGLINRFYLAQNFRRAIAQAEEVLEFNPRSVSALSIMSLCCAQTGMFDEALKISDRVIAIQPLNELYLFKSYILALAGRKTEARAILDTVLNDSRAGAHYDFTDAAAVFAALGQSAAAFDYLERAVAAGGSNILFLKTDVRFANIRDDRRFAECLAKMNLAPNESHPVN